MTQDQRPLSNIGIPRTAIFSGASSGALPKLGETEIHVWVVDTTAPYSIDKTSVEFLSPAEHERASKFRFDVDRTCFLRRRTALRAILGGYLGVTPREVGYSVNEFGKPALSAPQASAALSFNTSHSATLALIAVARSGRIGVDVEQLRPLVEAESIAAHYFAPNEAAAFVALEPRERVEGFFNAWTRKESIVKAVGGGLSIPLDTFEVSLRPCEPPAILRWDIPDSTPQRWRLYHLQPVPGYVGALAVDGDISIKQIMLQAV
jgi:4'-phosphopantetheinyl transferase